MTTPSTGQRIPRKQHEKVCETCGKQFIAARSHRRFCSSSCANRSRIIEVRVCDGCGTEYGAWKPKQRYCGAQCRQAGIARATAQARAEKRRGTGTSGWYIKYLGRHEHRVVAEQKIGRPISPDEVVHHIDGNKQNNHPDNLEVMTRSEHTRLHTTEYWEKKRAA